MNHPFPWATQPLVVDGIRLATWQVGEGAPLLMLHGYPQSRLCWRHHIGALSGLARVIAVDWGGWGESERSTHLSVRYDEEVKRLGKLLDALGLDAVHLIGHDYGGLLGLGFTQRYPQRVHSFAILNSRAHATFPGGFHHLFASLCTLARTRGGRALLHRAPIYPLHRLVLARYIRLGCFAPEILDHYLHWMATPEGRRWFTHFYSQYEVTGSPALASGLADIRCPVAIIWGDRDPFCPFPIAESLHAGIAGATLTRIAGGDHFIMEERPVEVLTALQRHLESALR